MRVSAIGLGTEHLKDEPQETINAVMAQAVEGGINYMDLVFSLADLTGKLSKALQGRREQVFLTGHLGSVEKNGQYQKTRSVSKSEATFSWLLDCLQTDHVDVLFLHNCDTQRDYQELTKAGGQMDLAMRLRDQGKARAIGFGGHTVATALQAVETGVVDVLMFPINLSGNAIQGKRELLASCAARGVGVVAMKPYAGGKLLSGESKLQMNRYLSGGASVKVAREGLITPVQCLSYVLSQVGVSVALPGCRSVAHVQAALAYLEASPQERDYTGILSAFEQYVEGECVYCNHCLPCPSQIDIGQVMRLLDQAQGGAEEAARAGYALLNAKAGDCIQCAACVERCPFGVDPMAAMASAAALFG